jgi:hypothetical protein
MFCQNCGTQLADGATTCASCSTAVVTPGPAMVAAQTVDAASKDAWRAIRLFVPNPVPGLPAALEALGKERALRAGIAFGAAFVLCFILAGYRVLPDWTRPSGVIGFVKMLLVAVAPVVGLFAASAVTRKVFRGVGGLADDSFISGASCLPFSCLALLAAILGPGNIQLIAPCALFAGCVTILMLFGALTRIGKISERAATLAVPLILIATTWLSKLTYAALLQNS